MGSMGLVLFPTRNQWIRSTHAKETFHVAKNIIIGLPLQQEGHGGRYIAFEATVHVRGRVLELGLKHKTALKAKPNPVRKIVHYPDVYPPNAKSTLRSLIPALAKKCVVVGEKCTRGSERNMVE